MVAMISHTKENNVMCIFKVADYRHSEQLKSSNRYFFATGFNTAPVGNLFKDVK